LLRYRKIAAAPARTSSQSWQAIAGVIRESLGRSESIAPAAVDASLAKAENLVRQLIAGGHLDKEASPLRLIAADLDVCFNTVSGDQGLALEENLNFVPGAALATDWTLYLPTPEPFGSLAEDLAAADDHLSAATPPEPSAAAKSEGGVLDRAALREWAREGS
jgi:hypothetical protein